MIFKQALLTGFLHLNGEKEILFPFTKKTTNKILKIIEQFLYFRFVVKYLKDYFNEMFIYFSANKFISKNQSRFQLGDSCINQLLSITHEIFTSFDNGLKVRSAFLDISKAFDKVWHEGLILKLKQNGISGELLHILSDFLSNRKQRVLLNGQNSSCANVYAGVPQESVLCTLLLLIYINDLSDNLISNAKLFTDDASLFSVVHDINTYAKELNDDFKKVNDWALRWKKSFNPDLSKQAQEVIFSRKLKRATHPPLVFNNNNVSQTYSQKHLGVI